MEHRKTLPSDHSGSDLPSTTQGIHAHRRTSSHLMSNRNSSVHQQQMDDEMFTGKGLLPPYLLSLQETEDEMFTPFKPSEPGHFKSSEPGHFKPSEPGHFKSSEPGHQQTSWQTDYGERMPPRGTPQRSDDVHSLQTPYAYKLSGSALPPNTRTTQPTVSLPTWDYAVHGWTDRERRSKEKEPSHVSSQRRSDEQQSAHYGDTDLNTLLSAAERQVDMLSLRSYAVAYHNTRSQDSMNNGWTTRGDHSFYQAVHRQDTELPFRKGRILMSPLEHRAISQQTQHQRSTHNGWTSLEQHSYHNSTDCDQRNFRRPSQSNGQNKSTQFSDTNSDITQFSDTNSDIAQFFDTNSDITQFSDTSGATSDVLIQAQSSSLAARRTVTNNTNDPVTQTVISVPNLQCYTEAEDLPVPRWDDELWRSQPHPWTTANAQAQQPPIGTGRKTLQQRQFIFGHHQRWTHTEQQNFERFSWSNNQTRDTNPPESCDLQPPRYSYTLFPPVTGRPATNHNKDPSQEQQDLFLAGLGGVRALGAAGGVRSLSALGGAGSFSFLGSAGAPSVQGDARASSAQGSAGALSVQGGAGALSAQGGARARSAQGGAGAPSAQGGAGAPSAQGGVRAPSAQGGATGPAAQGGVGPAASRNRQPTRQSAGRLSWHFRHNVNNLFPLEKVLQFGKSGDDQSEFREPNGVTVFAKKKIAIADTNNQRVQIFNNDCFVSQFSVKEGPQDGYPNKIVYAGNNTFVVTCRKPMPQLKVYNFLGKLIQTFGQQHIRYPRGIAVDENDSIIVMENQKPRISIFLRNSGEYSLSSVFSCTHVNFPTGLAVRQGQIFVSDNMQHNVKVYDYHGQLMNIVGHSGASDHPIGVMISSNDHVLIAGNHDKFNLTVWFQGRLLATYRSRIKHEDCLDIAILEESRTIVLTCKDDQVYLYRMSENGPL